MNGSLRDPPRWKDSADQLDLSERAAGRAFRHASAAPRRPAPPLARVAVRIRVSRPPRRLAWALAATAFVLGVATAASATHLDLLPVWLTNIIKPQPDPCPHDGARPPRKKAMSPTSPTQPPPSPPAPPTETPATPSAPPVAAPRAVRTTPSRPSRALPAAARASSSPRQVALVERDQHQPVPSRPSLVARLDLPQIAGPTPAPAPTPAIPEVVPGSRQPTGAPTHATSIPPLVAGSTSPEPSPKGVGRYLAETIRLLRKERAPAPALQYLDDHEPELARAGFGHEALILRVEALLALDRRAEVLRLLDRSSLSDVAASRALLVTRGELRAAADRCAEGIGDFELVLARARQIDPQALAGRALCRKKLGDLAGARADTQRLHQAFPNEPLPGGGVAE